MRLLKDAPDEKCRVPQWAAAMRPIAAIQGMTRLICRNSVVPAARRPVCWKGFAGRVYRSDRVDRWIAPNLFELSTETGQDQLEEKQTSDRGYTVRVAQTLNGANGGTRTREPITATDFKSIQETKNGGPVDRRFLHRIGL